MIAQDVAEADANGAGKATNPKDAIGSTKLPLELVPETAIALESLSFLEGALKYGQYNWRVGGVRASIYIAAMLRHAFKYWNGEDFDPVTKVPHEASIRACAGIIVDARACGKLTDDRPPPVPMGEFIAECEATAAHLRELFKGHNPKQWTIADVIVKALDAKHPACTCPGQGLVDMDCPAGVAGLHPDASAPAGGAR